MPYLVLPQIKDNQPHNQHTLHPPEMCKIVHISDSMSVTDKSVEINSMLTYKEPANFTCNDEKDTAICANAGQNVSLYCNKGNYIRTSILSCAFANYLTTV